MKRPPTPKVAGSIPVARPIPRHPGSLGLFTAVRHAGGALDQRALTRIPAPPYAATLPPLDRPPQARRDARDLRKGPGPERARMFELTTLFALGSLFFGLTAVDSYFTSDTVQIRVEMTARAEDLGLSEDATEEVIRDELRQIFEPESALRLPRLRIAARRSLVSEVSRSIGIDNFGFAIQEMLRLEPVALRVLILPPVENRQARVVAFGVRPRGGHFEVIVPVGEAGLPAALRAAARSAAFEVDTYHAWLSEARRISDAADETIQATNPALTVGSPEYNRAAEEATRVRLRGLADRLSAHLQRWTLFPGADEAALFNLYGVLRYVTGDTTAAEEAFHSSHALMPELEAPRLNLATIRIAQGRSGEALALANAALAAVQADRRTAPSVRLALEAAAHGTIGAAYDAMDRDDEAIRAWNTACTLRPHLVLLMDWYDLIWRPALSAEACYLHRADRAAAAREVRTLERLGFELLLLGYMLR